MLRPMSGPGPTLDELQTLQRTHHVALRRFVLSRLTSWNSAAIRRTARHGLAVLTAMLRRIIFLLAREVRLPPLRPRERLPALPRSKTTLRSGRRFRITDAPRPPRHRQRNPSPVPDPPALSHALFLERLARLDAAWRARHRIARRLARHIKSGAKNLRPAHTSLRDYPRLPDGFARMLDHLDDRLQASARGPP